MAATINTISISPQTVNTEVIFKIEVSATFVINFDTIENISWNNIDTHTWIEIDDTE